MWISYLYTRPVWRGKGIASHLYEKAREEATRRGISELLLDVYCSNQGSVKFHTSLGFVPEFIILQKTL